MARRSLHCLSPVSLLVKRQTQLLTELTSVASSPYMLQRHLWISIRLESSTIVNSFTCLPSIYVHNIQYFALPQCWHDWLEHLCPGWAGQCHYPVGKARKCTGCQIKKKIRRHYFHNNLCINLHKTCFEIMLPSIVVWYLIKAYVNWNMTWGQSPKL